jgi:hypothetical protein
MAEPPQPVMLDEFVTATNTSAKNNVTYLSFWRNKFIFVSTQIPQKTLYIVSSGGNYV